MGRYEDPWITRHRLTVDDYHRMGETGVLARDARVELLEGEVIDMAPIGSRHWSVVNRLNRNLSEAVGRRALVSVQSSLRLSVASELQPDIALLRPRADFYAAGLPTGHDALLVIEVADTTAVYDCDTKASLYARHGVPVYWVFDLKAGLLRVFGTPQDGEYADVSHTDSPGQLALPGLDGVTVDLASLLR